MRRCAKCGAYTLRGEHCGLKTLSAHPPKYGPDDRYAAYRRKEKGFEDV